MDYLPFFPTERERMGENGKIFVFLLLLFQLGWGFMGERGHRCWRSPSPPPAMNLPLFYWLERLDLNTSQREKVIATIQRYRTTLRALPTHFQIFLKAMAGGEFNRTIYIQERKKVAFRRIEYQGELFSKIMEILTPHQRKKLLYLLEGGVGGE
ncbi:MAG: hypothetical protein C6I01_04835 [Epsilonproteobacteria bacterium]|nr:hypothetical protein [Campylobacterota bacterium]